MPTQHVRPDNSESLQIIANAILKARKVVVVTGAGISTNSGIPDFRSENGLYQLIQEQYEAAARAALPGSKTASIESRHDASNTEDFPDSRPRKRQRVSSEESSRHITRKGTGQEKTRGRSPQPPSRRRRSNSLPPPSSPQPSDEPNHLPSSPPCAPAEELEISQFPRSKPRASSSGPGPRRSLFAERRASRAVELPSAQPNGQQDPSLPVNHEREAVYAALRTPLKRRTNDLRTILPLSSSPLSSPPVSDGPSFQHSSPLSRLPQLLSSSPPLSSPPTVLFDPREYSSPLSGRTSDFDDSPSPSEGDTAETPTTPSSPEASAPQKPSEAQSKAARLPIANLKGRDLFDASIWACPIRTSTFYRFITSLRQRVQEAEPTTSHYFISHLRDRGKLVRCYTQNIDRIEEKVGLSTELARGAGHRSRFSTRKSALSRGNSTLPAGQAPTEASRVAESQTTGPTLPGKDSSHLGSASRETASQQSNTETQASGSSSDAASGTAKDGTFVEQGPKLEAPGPSPSPQETPPESSQSSQDSSQNTDDQSRAQAATGTGPVTAKPTQRRQPIIPSNGVECVLLHGSLEKLRCFLCRRLSDWDGGGRAEDTLSGLQPECPHCVGATAAREERGKRALGVGKLRPDIVLYGEDHPSSLQISDVITHDLGLGPDLLLILGTSLKVHGLKTVVKELAKAVHSKGGNVVFVNFTKPSESSWGDVIDYWVEWDCDAWVADMKDRAPLLWLPPGTVVDEPSKKRKRNSGGGERKKTTARKPASGKKILDTKATGEKIESCIVATSDRESVCATIAVADPDPGQGQLKKPRKALPTSRPSILPPLRPSPQTSAVLVRHPEMVGAESTETETEPSMPHPTHAATVEGQNESSEVHQPSLACNLRDLKDAAVAEGNVGVLVSADTSLPEQGANVHEPEVPSEPSVVACLPELMAVPVSAPEDVQLSESDDPAEAEITEEAEQCREPEAAEALIALAAQTVMPHYTGPDTMLPVEAGDAKRAADDLQTPPTEDETSKGCILLSSEEQDASPEEERQVEGPEPPTPSPHAPGNMERQTFSQPRHPTSQIDEGQAQDMQQSPNQPMTPQEESRAEEVHPPSEPTTSVDTDQPSSERQDLRILEAESRVESVSPMDSREVDCRTGNSLPSSVSFNDSDEAQVSTVPFSQEAQGEGIPQPAEHRPVIPHERAHATCQEMRPQAGEVPSRVEDTQPPFEQLSSLKQERAGQITEAQPASSDDCHTVPNAAEDHYEKQSVEPRAVPKEKVNTAEKPWYKKSWNGQRNDYVNGAYLGQLIVEDLCAITGRAIFEQDEFPSVAATRALMEEARRLDLERDRARARGTRKRGKCHSGAARRQKNAEAAGTGAKLRKKGSTRVAAKKKVGEKRQSAYAAAASATLRNTNSVQSEAEAAASTVSEARSKKPALIQRTKRATTRLRALAAMQRKRGRAEEAKATRETHTTRHETASEPFSEPSSFIAESVKTRRRTCTGTSMDREQVAPAELSRPSPRQIPSPATTQRTNSREPTKSTKRKSSAMPEPRPGTARRSQRGASQTLPLIDADMRQSQKRKYTVMAQESPDPNRRRSKRLKGLDGEAAAAPNTSAAAVINARPEPLPSPKSEFDNSTRRRSTRINAPDRQTATIGDLPTPEPTEASPSQMRSTIGEQGTRGRRRSSRFMETTGEEVVQVPAPTNDEQPAAVDLSLVSSGASGAPPTPPDPSRMTMSERSGTSGFIEERVKLRARRGRVSYTEPATDDEGDEEEQALPASTRQQRTKSATPVEKNQKMGPRRASSRLSGGCGPDGRSVSTPLVEISGNHRRASPAVVEATKVG